MSLIYIDISDEAEDVSGITSQSQVIKQFEDTKG
jgi:hypothetical protein